MSDWQPIETAPKDGTRVLLADRYNRLTCGMWAPPIGEEPWDTFGYFVESWGRERLMGVAYWAPVDEPPA